MNSTVVAPQRTILYYPTITIPSGAWLKQALLYWDNVASIVPYQWDETESNPYSPDVQFLLNEQQFRPIRPKYLFNSTDGQAYIKEFEEELKSKVSSISFYYRTYKPSVKKVPELNSKIHRDKISDSLFDFIETKGLAKKDKHNPNWYLFEEKTALTYMSFLAKYLADIDFHSTVSGTDNIYYQSVIYRPSSRQKSFPCLDIRFLNALPFPKEDVPLNDIIEFKRKRRDELLNFRQILDDFQYKISSAEDNSELKHIIVCFKESIERGLNDLNATLNDAKISTIAGSFKAAINIKSTQLITTFGLIAAKVANVIKLPVELALGGLAGASAIEVGSYLVDSRNQKRVTIRTSPFSYLYHAEVEGIIMKRPYLKKYLS